MATVRNEIKSDLGKKLQAYRADRPDEWTMDEFTREAEKMQARNAELEAALCEIKNIVGELSGQNPANFCEEVAMEHDAATFQVYEISNKVLAKALKDNS